jgi:hypothetical protein
VRVLLRTGKPSGHWVAARGCSQGLLPAAHCLKPTRRTSHHHNMAKPRVSNAKGLRDYKRFGVAACHPRVRGHLPTTTLPPSLPPVS